MASIYYYTYYEVTIYFFLSLGTGSLHNGVICLSRLFYTLICIAWNASQILTDIFLSFFFFAMHIFFALYIVRRFSGPRNLDGIGLIGGSLRRVVGIHRPAFLYPLSLFRFWVFFFFFFFFPLSFDSGIEKGGRRRRRRKKKE
jgi:hypothetical protein